MKNEAKRYALYVSVNAIEKDIRNEGGRAFVSVVEVREDNKICNGLDTEWDNLILYCQWTKGIGGGKPFAFEVEYRDVYSVGACKAKRMMKMFQKVARAEKKFTVQPETFGQYCVLMARGLGLKGLVKRVDGNDKYVALDEGEFRHFSLNEAQYVIDRMIADVQQERGVAA